MNNDEKRPDEDLLSGDETVAMTHEDAAPGIDTMTILDSGVRLDALGDIQSRIADCGVPAQRYDCGEEVARGGMGSIRLARDRGLRRRVAMKTLLKGQGLSEEMRTRFVEEAQITGQLEHPGIVPIHELGLNESGDIFYTMKYVNGHDLSEVLHGIKTGDAEIVAAYPLSRLLTIFVRVCDAISFAHAKGVIHRDLKPANIMVGEFGEVLVMDWGLAKILNADTVEPEGRPISDSVLSDRADSNSEDLKTMAGTVVGSPQFMAPEQAAGQTEHIDERADIYALGAILYQILTLQMPLEGTQLMEVLEHTILGKIKNPLDWPGPFPHTPDGQVSPALAAVSLRALALEPVDRYRSVERLKMEIEAWLNGFATRAEDASMLRQLTLLVRRHKVTAIAAVLIFLLTLVSSVINLYERNRARDSESKAVAALKDLERSETERREQARLSAPAYLKSSLALESQREFEMALTTLERTLDFDPKLFMAHKIKSMLLTREGRYPEALEVARVFASLRPDDFVGRELVPLLERAVADPDKVPFMELGQLASRTAMHMTSTDLIAKQTQISREKFGELLPVWRATIDKAWPGLGGRLSIDKQQKLAFVSDGRFGAVMKDLEPLRGIPLEVLSLRNYFQVSSLEPLYGAPLAMITLVDTPVHSIDPLRGMPLRRVVLDKLNRNGFTDLSPLEGMQLDVLQLGGSDSAIRDMSPLAAVQLRALRIYYIQANDLEFLRHQKQLEKISFTCLPSDGDYTPLLACASLREVSESWLYVTKCLLPALDFVATGEIDAAVSNLQDLKAIIASDAFVRLESVIDTLLMLIETRDDPSQRKAIESHCVQVVGSKTFFVQPCTTIQAWKVKKICEVLSVQLASVESEAEERQVIEMMKDYQLDHGILIGGKKDVTGSWSWGNGAPWGFHRLPDTPLAGNHLMIQANGNWISTAPHNNNNGQLLQW
jgi:serine/threonine protein kinase